MSDDNNNFPEAKSSADRIARKASELLDQDEWDVIWDSGITVRGVEIRVDVGKGQSSVCVPTGVEGGSRSYQASEAPAQAYREIVVASVKGATDRYRERLLVPILGRIENDNHKRDMRNRSLRYWCLYLGIGALAVFLAAGGVRSCMAAEDRNAAKREADLNRVNEYGFRKGSFATNKRFEYPSSCQTITRPISDLAECRESFEYWEKQGDVWIEWDDPA